MLKSTYKFLNTLIHTISNPTGARSRVRTPLLPVGGWKAHPPLSAMHALPLEPGLLCLCAYPCSSLPPASPCAGQKKDTRSPSRGSFCGCTQCRQPRSLRGTGTMVPQAEAGARWQRGDSWQHPRPGPTAALSAFPLPRLSHPTATSFLPSFVLVLKLALLSKASR